MGSFTIFGLLNHVILKVTIDRRISKKNYDFKSVTEV